MATAAKFRIEVSIEALLMKSNQLPHLEEEWQCHF
jgi:hypothetical protein